MTRHQKYGAPALLAAEPFLRLRDRLVRLSADRRALTPVADPGADALDQVTGWLDNAITEASELDVVIDVATAERMLNVSVSMVTHLCRKGPERGGLDARKVGGEWRILRASVERMLSVREGNAVK